MRYLYIDTSSSYLYTAIVENNKLISEIKEENKIQFVHIYNNEDLIYTTTAINGVEVIDRNEVDDVIEIKIYK